MSSGFALIAILPILVRRLSDDEYNVWTLVVQTPAYVSLLGAGVSVAVVRMVSAAEDRRRADLVVGAAVGFVRRVVMFSMLGVLAGVVVFPLVFTAVPNDLLGGARLGVLAVGSGASLALLAVPYQSYFNGRHENGASSIAAVVTRFAGAGAAVVLLPFGLAAMFVALGVSLAGSSLVQRWLYRRRSNSYPPAESVDSDRAERSALQAEIVSFARTVGIWSVVSVMSAGLDIAVVGALDFERVGAYGAAAGIVMILSGVHTAAMNAFLPDATRAVEVDGGRTAMIGVSRVSGLIIWMSVGGVLAFGRPVLEFAFGDDLAADAMPILAVLILGRSVNNLVWPYVVFVLAAGQHDKIRITPIVEGVVNLVVSVALVSMIGAVGAAIGTLVAATLAVVMHLTINARRTTLVSLDRSGWLGASTLVPIACSAPMFAVAMLDGLTTGAVPPPIGVGALVVSLGLSGWRLVQLREEARSTGSPSTV